MTPDELNELLVRVNEYVLESLEKCLATATQLLSLTQDTTERIDLMIEIEICRDKIAYHERLLKGFKQAK